MVNLRRLTTAGLQTSSQRLTAATMAEPTAKLNVVCGALFFMLLLLIVNAIQRGKEVLPSRSGV